MADATEDALGAEQRGILQQLEDMKLSFDREQWLSDQEPHMRKRFEYLHEVQDSLDDLQSKLDKERHTLELKYRALMEPHFTSRRDVVLGNKVPEGGEGEEQGIPEFWLQVFTGNEEFAGFISEKDTDILKHLRDVRIEHIEPDEAHQGSEGGDEDEDDDDDGIYGYKVVFTFDENPFFEGTELTKVYAFTDVNCQVPYNAEGTDIKWRQGKDPTQKTMKKRNKNGQVKYKTEAVESFFNFFTVPEMPDPSGAGDVDVDAIQSIGTRPPAVQELEQHYDLGNIIRYELVPNALKWYTGEAALEEGVELGEEDDDDEEEEDDDDDDDGEDDDRDEDDDDRLPLPGPPTDSGGQADQECKQQ